MFVCCESLPLLAALRKQGHAEDSGQEKIIENNNNYAVHGIGSSCHDDDPSGKTAESLYVSGTLGVTVSGLGFRRV